MELRDLDDARNYVLQGLWLSRSAAGAPEQLASTLEWINCILAEGDPLPPIGFVADLGLMIFGNEPARELPTVPGWTPVLADHYLHHVLGKFYADALFERAGYALTRYDGKDRARGLAYLIKQFRARANLDGVSFSNAVIRSLLKSQPNDLLNEGYESLSTDGLHPLLISQYESLISATRKLSEVLGPEDVIALEQRTALADMSRYVAHRQILTLTALFESHLPQRPVRPLIGRREVPTRILDEDQYPVGGYSSISNRGSIESLLHSQLAYMEPVESPDLFDVKFVRDELFYYARDENQFLRRRRVFAFVFDSNLVQARFKDAELPAQRIVLACSSVLAIIRKLTNWLASDALAFELHFLRDDNTDPLADEAELFSLLLLEAIANKTATVTRTQSRQDLLASLARTSRQAQVHILDIAHQCSLPEPEGTLRHGLELSTARPTLFHENRVPFELASDDPLEAWFEVIHTLLESWI